MEIQFQKLIDQFKTPHKLKFIKLVKQFKVSSDDFIYEIMTDKGVYFIYEVDFINEFQQDLVNKVSNIIHKEVKYFKVKRPIKLEDSSPYKAASLYTRFPDWDKIELYANDKYGSDEIYFNFLIEATEYKGSKALIRKYRLGVSKIKDRLFPITPL